MGPIPLFTQRPACIYHSWFAWSSPLSLAGAIDDPHLCCLGYKSIIEVHQTTLRIMLFHFRQRAAFLFLLSYSLLLSPAWAGRRHSHAAASTSSSSSSGPSWLEGLQHTPKIIWIPALIVFILAIFWWWHASYKDCNCKCGLNCKCKCRCSSTCPCTVNVTSSKGKFDM